MIKYLRLMRMRAHAWHRDKEIEQPYIRRVQIQTNTIDQFRRINERLTHEVNALREIIEVPYRDAVVKDVANKMADQLNREVDKALDVGLEAAGFDKVGTISIEVPTTFTTKRQVYQHIAAELRYGSQPKLDPYRHGSGLMTDNAVRVLRFAIPPLKYEHAFYTGRDT